jgi:hypothetical protein
MIRMSVLRRQTSHLLFIPTNLGYGTVLTAVSARPGCSATYHHTCESIFRESCSARIFL